MINSQQVKSFQDQLFRAAIQYARTKLCPKCHTAKHWNVVPLYEENPFFPSQMVLYCKKCKHHEPAMWFESSNQMRGLMLELRKMWEQEQISRRLEEASQKEDNNN